MADHVGDRTGVDLDSDSSIISVSPKLVFISTTSYSLFDSSLSISSLRGPLSQLLSSSVSCTTTTFLVNFIDFQVCAPVEDQ